ncbi:MAG: transporter [Lachnospiraceae bacterium]|nr:transporter [Candidatus Minthocola equi]
MDNMGIISLIPIVIAIALSLITRNTVFSLAIACIIGCFISGAGVWGFTDLIMESLGNADFIWVAFIILFFGVLVSYYEKSGAIDGFTAYVQSNNLKRRGVQLLSWFLGLFCFADSMSPLFVGSVMRRLSDKAKISREKLAYIADSTASPLAVICPYSSWPSYVAGLIVGIGCIGLNDTDVALHTVFKSIPLNFYAIACVALVGLIGAGVIKDFGPMKKAEKRAQEEGKLIADGAVPLSSTTAEGKGLLEKPRVFINFILPTVLLVVITVLTGFVGGEMRILEAVTIIIILMSISFLIQGMKLKDLMSAFSDGITGAMPALMVLAVAYPLNTLSSHMGTANYIIQITEGFLTPALLPFVIFVICAILSFATGTSWGTYAICLPLALPIAFAASDNQISLLVLLCLAAVQGGGVFGDHCSPVSDTTIMASMGAGSDHVDHVKTQLPYALISAGVAAILYLILGFIAA